MSSIYIQEPPTNGKVCLKTTVGDIDIELWSRECPKAARNFVQLCMEGYYNGTIFHRVVPGFIAQGGDPTGTGSGGESIYGKPFRDEIHQRLRFVRRGLVAMANSGPHDNASQFFFTLDQCPELQGKHTIFGKVVGDTLFNMLKLGEADVDANERPSKPHKILGAEVIDNPFKDVQPRALPSRQLQLEKEESERKEKEKSAMKPVKNFNLLSFGEEAEEEEVESDRLSRAVFTKGKSAHDAGLDEKLSALPAVGQDELFRKKESNQTEKDKEEAEEMKRKVMEKFEDRKAKMSKTADMETEDDEDLESLLWKDKRDAEKAKIEEVKAEVKRVRRELAAAKAKKDEPEEPEEEEPLNPAKEAYLAERKKYEELGKTAAPRKTTNREEQTLAMLEKFKSKLIGVRSSGEELPKDQPQTEVKPSTSDDDDSDYEDSTWMASNFSAEVEALRQAKDANRRDEETFSIYDPRNPLVKRRNEQAAKAKAKQWSFPIDIGKRPRPTD